jgi:hypothetical protein
LFVDQDVLINPLVTDLDMMMFRQPTRNLFRAPIQTHFRFDQYLCFRLDTTPTFPAPVHRQAMSLLWSIAALTMITFQLPTDGRFVHSNAIGDFRLIMTHFQQRKYLVSL